jgi:hypothetical protein
MMDMRIFEDKYFVFLTSAGRTGTKFFGDLLGEMVENAFSVHEPDVLVDFKLKSIRQLQMFGLYNLIIGKLLNKTGIRNLSQNYLAGTIKLTELKAAIVDHREKFYGSIDKKLIIESYSGWYGAIPGIQSLYKNYKMVVIVRDPRDWVISNMNWGTMYGKRDWISRLKLGRLNPSMINDSQYIDKWQNFTHFQKLCWAWKTIYETILKSAEKDPNAIIIKFEDLFQSENKYDHLRRLLSFITRYSDKNFSFNIPENILERKTNVNISYSFPKFESWGVQMKTELAGICGEITKNLGYSPY